MIKERNKMVAQNNLDESSDEELLLLKDFIRHFNVHYALLIKRYARYKELNNNAEIDAMTYFDMIIVQLRAILVENIERHENRNNYTVIVLLKRLGKNEQAEKISSMLNEPFFPNTNFSIRKALKHLANKIICHYDNFDGERLGDWSLAETIEMQLRNPYVKVNLDYIMKTMIDSLDEGLTVVA